MTGRGAGSNWRAFGNSVRGARHVKYGQPNQDALQVWSDPSTGRAAAAVADGHGAKLHPRSAVGAQLATAIAIETLRPRLGAAAPPSARQQQAMVAEVGTRWQEAVAAHLRATPFGAGELEQLAQEMDVVASNATIAYGTTLLVAGATADWVVLLQIGDGDILGVTESGTTTRPLPHDPLLVGGRTISLCQREAWSAARTATLAGSGVPELILLSTDGYANAFQTDADFLAIGADYARLLREDADALSARLPAILGDASEHGSADDVTLAILYRE